MLPNAPLTSRQPPAPPVYELTDSQVAEILRFTRGRVLLRPVLHSDRRIYGGYRRYWDTARVAPVLGLYEAEYALRYFWPIVMALGPIRDNEAAAVAIGRVNSLFDVFQRNLRVACVAGRCEVVRASFGDLAALQELLYALTA